MARLTFPPPEKIYGLSDPVANRPMRGNFEGDKDWEISSGEFRPRSPIDVRWDMGEADPSDIIWTTSAHPLILHERIVELFGQHRFKGWRTYKVRVFNKRGKLVRGYFGLVVTGRCGHQDVAASKVVVKRYPGGWCPEFLGRYFSPGPWAGEDIFLPGPYPGEKGVSSMWRLITEPVVTALRKAGVTNIHVERTTETTEDVGNFEILRPDRLPADYWQRIEAAYVAARKPMPDFVKEWKAELAGRIEKLRRGRG